MAEWALFTLVIKPKKSSGPCLKSNFPPPGLSTMRVWYWLLPSYSESSYAVGDEGWLLR